MTAKRIVLSPQARRDVRQATAWYREEGGSALAQSWAAALEDALVHIGANPKIGSTRYAVLLKLDELRCWPMQRFPYLIFYIEHEPLIEVGRVLHAERNIPAGMGAA